MNRVVVTGLGAISAIGNSPSAVFDAALSARPGVRLAPELALDASAPLVASADFDPSTIALRHRGVPMDRATAMGVAAARQAMIDAQTGDLVASPRAGVYWGTGMGGAGTLEDCYRSLFRDEAKRFKPTTIVTVMGNAPASVIALEFGATGPVLTYSVACASSAIALGEAMRAIRHGVVDIAIAGGSDALLTRGVLAAWAALRTLARGDRDEPSRACKPFAADRSGFVLGEGAGAVLLENAERAVERGARIYAELAGFGSTNDATHMADPSSDGQARAMSDALRDADIAASDVGYVNAHGTATMVGDRVEVASIRRVFGEHAGRLAVSSTKPLHGHMMGATGVVEFMIALLALRSGSLPPTAHLTRPDPELDLDFVPNTARHGVELSAVASNSFAFGGSNAVLVACRHRAAQRIG